MMKTVNVGIIGGGLMGREVASAFARWCVMKDMPVTPVLAGVADVNAGVLEWFRAVPSARILTADYKELLASPDIDVVYVAVPHHLHESIYLDVLKAGKDLFAEKPFGIDLGAARRITAAAERSGKFVRCSSEFPFLPGAQRIIKACTGNSMGRILEVRSGLLHASDLDPDKPANWKRFSSICGEGGVLNDLGMHTLHIPLRLGWKPHSVYAQLQKGYPQRPGTDGKPAACDTWDNATLHTWIEHDSQQVPMRLEMKRMSPGATNTWLLEVLGTNGGMRYSTAEPKSLHTFRRAAKDQVWERTDLGFEMPFATITGGIFEVGFPDVMQQMWASFLLEREGVLGSRFGCVTPREALASHDVFAAALASQAGNCVAPVAA